MGEGQVPEPRRIRGGGLDRCRRHLGTGMSDGRRSDPPGGVPRTARGQARGGGGEAPARGIGLGNRALLNFEWVTGARYSVSV
jgi:hypothetical protein